MAIKEWNDEAIIKKVLKINRQNLELACEYVRSAAASTCPVVSGDTRSGYDYKVVSNEKGTVFNPTETSLFIELGTKAHDIRPVNAKALFWKGAQHPVKVVHHPGTKAQHILQKALYNSKSAILRIMKLQ